MTIVACYPAKGQRAKRGRASTSVPREAEGGMWTASLCCHCRPAVRHPLGAAGSQGLPGNPGPSSRSAGAASC